jgi:predicted adenylyl cyclase CyaB
MHQHLYEVEIKSLLGGKESADAFKKRLIEVDPETKLVAQNKQLNHYFTEGDRNKLIEKVGAILTPAERSQFEKLVREASDFSLRTRQMDNQIILVLKISMSDETSANGVKRLEFEASIPQMSLEELDQLLLIADFRYQAKWSREREEYRHKNATVTVDKNAGYGYVAEFEMMENDESKIDETKNMLLELMATVGVEELSQERLGRMFDYYNNHWQEYYGTDKVFEIP